jgi:hypothetical protein
VGSPAVRIQPKLTVNDPGDRYEKEAERVADAVMRMPDGGNENPKEKLPEDRIQRMCPRCRRRARKGKPLNCEECEQELQRKRDGSGGETAPVQQAAAATRGPGQPLPDRTQSFFEERMGADFSGVRVHTGGEADAAARSIDARAYTLGSDVVMRSGEYRPHSREGKRLLAHELTHVVQQSRSGSQSDLIQREQIGDVHPSGEKCKYKYFKYKIDKSMNTYSQLARYYGVETSDIESCNEKSARALRMGDEIRVPAIQPPSSLQPPSYLLQHIDTMQGGAMIDKVKNSESGVIYNSTTSNVVVRWNVNDDSNKVGSIPRGTRILYQTSGPSPRQLAFVYQSAIQNSSEGVIRELERRGRTIGGFVAVYVPTGNLRESGPPSEGRERDQAINAVARMIYGEQRGEGRAGMRAAAWVARNRYEAGWRGSYEEVVSAPNQFQGLIEKGSEKGEPESWALAQEVAKNVIEGKVPDPTSGALYFGDENILDRMKECYCENEGFHFGKAEGANCYFSNGDYSRGRECKIPDSYSGDLSTKYNVTCGSDN